MQPTANTKSSKVKVLPVEDADPAKVIYDFDLSRQDQSFSFRMREIVKLFVRAHSRALKVYGITIGQWQFLRALWEKEGQSQAELSDVLGTTSAATVFSVNLLERDGLAERVPDRTDQRRYLIHLTPRGRHLREALLPDARDLQLAALKDFSSSEIRQLSEFLNRIRTNLQEVVQNPPPPSGTAQPPTKPKPRHPKA